MVKWINLKKVLNLPPSINQKPFIMRKITFLLLFLVMAATASFGGGYQVYLHGMKNIGMGLIGTSLSKDASTLFLNPGGAAFLNDTWTFSGGVSFIMARTTFQPKDVMEQYKLEHQINTPLYFYAAYKPTPYLSVGLAINTPYGNGLSWGESWKGRFLIQDVTFKAFTFQPTVAYKYKDIFGIGAGLVYSYGTVELNKALPIEGTAGEGQLNVQGSTGKFGFNVGAIVHPVKGLSIGIDYKSKIEMAVDGAEADFTVPQALSAQFPDNKANVMLPLPANLDFGLSYEFGKDDRWLVGLNLNYVFWSQYDSLVFDFETKTSAVNRTATPALYENKLIPRIGAQYKLNDLITLRVGGYYDTSPVKDDYLNPQTPSTNQIGLTCGLSVYPMKGLSIDAAFLYIMGMERDGTYSPDNFAGTYKSTVYIPGIGLSYSF
jgi:long-chain fatty acid transport protein